MSWVVQNYWTHMVVPAPPASKVNKQRQTEMITELATGTGAQQLPHVLLVALSRHPSCAAAHLLPKKKAFPCHICLHLAYIMLCFLKDMPRSFWLTFVDEQVFLNIYLPSNLRVNHCT